MVEVVWYSTTMKLRRVFPVVFETDEDGYFVASVPGMQGCYTQAKTLEQAKERIKEVIELCLEESGQDSFYSPFITVENISL